MEQSNANPYAAPDSDVGSGSVEAHSAVTPFSAKGRIGRVRYMGYLMTLLLIGWLGMVLIGVLSAPVMSAHKGVAPPSVIVIMGIISVVMMIGGFMLAIQRIHDFDASGWLSLLLLVPFINGIFSIVLWFIPGTKGPNRFGAKTPPNGAGVTIMAILLPIFLIAYIGIISAIAIPAYQQYVKKAQEMHMQQGR